MTITIIEDKKITSFDTDFAEIVNGKLHYTSGDFTVFKKITSDIKHIFIDGIDVLSCSKKSEIKSESASKMTLKEFNKLYLGKGVHCKTEELANEFLELADSFGYNWSSGHKLTSFNLWSTFNWNTYYRIDRGKYVACGNVNVVNLPIVEFKGEIK